MKKINFNLIMSVFCPIAAMLYTFSAIARYINGSSTFELVLTVIQAVVWWVCAVLWIWLYYRDRKFKAELEAFKQRMSEGWEPEEE